MKILLILLLLFCTACSKDKTIEETQTNNNQNIKEEVESSNTDTQEKQEETLKKEIIQNVEKLQFKLINQNIKANESTFVTEIFNPTTEEIYVNEFTIDFYNEKDEKIVTLFGIVDSVIKPNEKITIESNYGGAIKNYKRINYQIIKNQ